MGSKPSTSATFILGTAVSFVHSFGFYHDLSLIDWASPQSASASSTLFLFASARLDGEASPSSFSRSCSHKVGFVVQCNMFGHPSTRCISLKCNMFAHSPLPPHRFVSPRLPDGLFHLTWYQAVSGSFFALPRSSPPLDPAEDAELCHSFRMSKSSHRRSSHQNCVKRSPTHERTKCT